MHVFQEDKAVIEEKTQEHADFQAILFRLRNSMQAYMEKNKTKLQTKNRLLQSPHPNSHPLKNE